MTSAIDIFARGARDGVYPGGQLAISREGRRLVTVSVGALGPGLGPTDDQVSYDLASLTKPLSTATLVGRAMQRGLMELNHPLARAIEGVDPRVTIERVLDHAAGFPAHKRFDETLPSGLAPGSWDAWRHVIREAAGTPLERSPGEEAVYSDIGFILLGAALEIAYGMPLSTAHMLMGTPLVFRDRRGPPALQPFPARHGIAPTEAGKTGVVHDENAEVMGGAAGHAGLFGTAEGVLKVAEQWLYAYHGLKGGLLEPEIVRRFWLPSGVRKSTRTLGWDRPSREGSSTGGQWPVTSVGHLGFTGTSVWVEPERGLVAALVTNRVCPSRANNLIRRLRPALHDAIWTEFSTAKPRATPKPRRDATPRHDTLPTASAQVGSAQAEVPPEPARTPLPREVSGGPTRRISTPPPSPSTPPPLPTARARAARAQSQAPDDEETVDARQLRDG